MKVKVLKHDEALMDGADLWILPSLQVSEWTRQLDWPLNLLITRAQHHPRPELAPELKKIVIENGMKSAHTAQSEEAPLLVGSQGLLPNRLTAVVPGTQCEPWIKSGLKLWQELRTPKARIFLPAFAPWEKVKATWPGTADVSDIEIVEPGTETKTEDQS